MRNSVRLSHLCQRQRDGAYGDFVDSSIPQTSQATARRCRSPDKPGAVPSAHNGQLLQEKAEEDEILVGPVGDPGIAELICQGYYRPAGASLSSLGVSVTSTPSPKVYESLYIME